MFVFVSACSGFIFFLWSIFVPWIHDFCIWLHLAGRNADPMTCCCPFISPPPPPRVNHPHTSHQSCERFFSWCPWVQHLSSPQHPLAQPENCRWSSCDIAWRLSLMTSTRTLLGHASALLPALPSGNGSFLFPSRQCPERNTQQCTVNNALTQHDHVWHNTYIVTYSGRYPKHNTQQGTITNALTQHDHVWQNTYSDIQWTISWTQPKVMYSK